MLLSTDIWVGALIRRVEIGGGFAVVARKGDPRAGAVLVKVLNRADVKEAWAKQGVEPLAMTPAEFDKYRRDDIAKWAKVIKDAGIKMQ